MEPYEIDGTVRLSKPTYRRDLVETSQMETYLLAGVLESVQPFLESMSLQFGWLAW